MSRTVFCCRPVETGSSSVQSLSLSDSHLAELDGDTLRLFGLGALEALERGWGVQTAAAVTVITFRYISFDAIVPTLPRIRVKFPNLSVTIRTECSRGCWCSSGVVLGISLAWLLAKSRGGKLQRKGNEIRHFFLKSLAPTRSLTLILR